MGETGEVIGFPERPTRMTGHELEVAERKAEAWRLRVNGMPPGVIAKHLGLTAHTVRGYITEAYDQLKDQAVLDRKRVALLEYARMERIMEAMMAHIPDPSRPFPQDPVDTAVTMAAVDRIIKISDRMSKLTGADAAPQRVQEEEETEEDYRLPEVASPEEAAVLLKIIRRGKQQALPESSAEGPEG